ncbi:MAG: glutamine--tRNA ligase/YqeY domain fusion protein [Planctomycetes bacterium]|nr:glutamine--tRNA ligase/YqeY domain fusion protein [Planctomycetota bacterium]MBI3835770.1 glutamine--tRNA ligase/YqeY domain fusion protein [Planctomycetota bacterium]
MNRDASNSRIPDNEPTGNRTLSLDFIRTIVADDVRTGKWGGRVQTRFPPEPNGYLHIGHAKSICLNFGIAREFGGKCNLRFDDTNPTAEDQEYVDSIQRDVRWLGWEWDQLLFASDYFQQMHDWAVELIKKGKAYVCDLPAEEISRYRGTLTTPGRESPSRNRAIDENLDLFDRMRRGEFPDGSKTLRAKIDMTHPNMNMRDPVMYRILHATHHNTGDKWCIYPMYDWAHGLEDSIEAVTHSICTLEFEDHRPLYDWYVDAINEGRGADSKWGEPIHHPQQIEFARLELTDTMMSKRKLLELVRGGDVKGWDDPRMPTLSGMRRRGYTPEAIRNFCEMIGVAKFNSTVDFAKLEFCVRDELNRIAPRVMAVLNPIKIVIDNYAAGQVEELDAVNNPEDSSAGTRKVPFSREIYIEQDDFRETPPPKFFRLSPGKEVRLRYAYFITCTRVVKDPKTGEITELHCTYDPATRGGDAPDGRKVKATLHWVSAEKAIACEVRLYDQLILSDKRRAEAIPNREREPRDESRVHLDAPSAPHDWRSNLNPRSLEIIQQAWVEPSIRVAPAGSTYQFERLGYFCVDSDSSVGRLVFNRTVSLKDTWAKVEKKDLTFHASH